jgi:galactokinase/mevalonate kinase-like predicted kinase
MILKTRAYPRAALIGNPSDGYFGKTIAFTFSNYQADVTLFESEQLEILPARRDRFLFGSLQGLAEDVQTFGYYGGIRLIKAALKRFADHCAAAGVALPARNFSIRYHTSIPAHLGLAGSSAIIAACMRAVTEFYGVEIPKPILANLILSVETEELGIGGGLQDRVAQVYQGMVHMDFDRETMERQGHGTYTALVPATVLNFYIAFKRTLAEGTEVVHNSLRYRWEQGDEQVRNAMSRFAALTDRFRDAFVSGMVEEIDSIINANFDLRRSIMDLNPQHVALVDAARKAGASAKFTGSGGAIIGTYRDEAAFNQLSQELGAVGAEVIKPEVVY